MPQALQRALALALMLALALVLALVPRPADATRAMGSITFPMPESKEQNVTASVPSLAASAFGFGADGRFTGTFRIDVDAAASCIGTVALCDVTDFIRRDLTFQRRVIPLSKGQVEEDVAVAACGGQERQIRCITSEFGNGSTKVSFSPKELGSENRIWSVNFAICPMRCDGKLTNTSDREFNFDVHMVNGDGKWRELGWEEVVFPAASAFVIAVASASWLAVTSIWLWRALVARRRRRVNQSQPSIGATPVRQSEDVSGFAGGDSSTLARNQSRLQRWSARAERRERQPSTSTVRPTHTRAPRPLPFELKLLFFAASAKLASSGLVCAYFWTVVKTGTRKSWYTPLRFPFMAMDDAAVTLLMLFMSTGEHSVPKAWIVDGRGGSLVIWINMSLQVVVFFLVKVMFPYRYLGFSIQFMFGLFIYGLTAYCSVRNARFLGKYAALIEKARIVVKSTPIPRMRLFFLVNAHILAFVWLVKVVAVGFFDSMHSRPDLLWALFEIADSLLLAWYTICVWPRAGSSLYVDLSHVDNTRLLEVERRRQQVAGLEAGERPSASTDLSTDASDTLNRGPEVEIDSPRVEYAMAGSDATTLSDGGSVMSVPVENGNAVAIRVQNDLEQLEWVYWVSGMSLPVPTASLWGTRRGIPENVQDGAFAASGRRPEPKALPLYNVFGSPTGAVDKLTLSVGVPVAGPLALEPDSSRNSTSNDSENGKPVSSRSDARDPRTAAPSGSFPRTLLGSVMGARSAHIAAMREASESPEPDGIHHDARPASSEQHAALQEGESGQERQSSTLTAASADGQVWSAGNV